MPCVLPRVPSGWWLSPLFSATLGRFWSSNHVPEQTGASIRPSTELGSLATFLYTLVAWSCPVGEEQNACSWTPLISLGFSPLWGSAWSLKEETGAGPDFQKLLSICALLLLSLNSVWILGGVPLAGVMESHISLPSLVSSLHSNQGDNTGQRVIFAPLIPHCPRQWVKRSPALVRKGKEKKTAKGGRISQQFWELSSQPEDSQPFDVDHLSVFCMRALS